jgi:hypothetical protein
MLCLSLAEAGLPETSQARIPRAPVAATDTAVADVERNFRREYERSNSGMADLPAIIPGAGVAEGGEGALPQ